MAQLSKIARWDKLKSWKGLEDEIEDRLNSSDKFDDAMTLEIGPQLLHTLRHRSALRCIEHTSSKFGEIFTCHFNKGAVQGVRVWVLELEGKDGSCKIKAFETECEITCMTYVTKHRVYLVFCSDLTLRVITDARSNFVEVECVPCLTTTLCLVYNKEDDEIYAGGIGTIEEWKIHGAEHAASLVPGRKFFTDLTRNDWIRDIKIVRRHNYMVAQHGNGLCVVHLKSRKQLHMLPNRHEGPLTCCCYYPQSDFLMTGGAEGKIRIFNGKEFDLLHVFTGHHGAVSAMEAHRKEALLFSASHDGTVRIWRMDNLQIFMRLDVGEKIYNMSLLSDTKFYFQTEKNILIYSCNQFCQFFAPLESDTKRLLCCRGKDHPNRILASTEDGSVWLFSPKTGLTLTIIYPMPSFQVLMSFAYDIHQDRLHTVLTGGKVITYNTSTNPCKAEEIWVPSCEDEQVNLLLLVTVEFPYDEGTDLDDLIFAGLTNGQIILCDAVACALECPVQAHEGAVTSLESSLHQSGVGHFGSGDNVSIVISGGTDKYVKVWKINIDADGRRPIVKLTLLFKVYLSSSPLHVCMYSQSLWVTTKTETERGTKWKLLLHKMVLIASSKTEASKRKHLLHNKYVLKVRRITHPDDEDHVKELTSLDKCPIMNVVMTSGKDGFVKIWSGENQLLREMNFATPIYASCFANDRGDILVGYGTHICSVSVVNYLPLDFLKQVISISKFCIKDDIREVPVKFDNKSEPWLDIANLREYSINSFDRRRQHLEEEVIERLKRGTEKDISKPKHKFVIFVDGKTTKVIRKDFADKLLGWAKGKTKLKFGVKKPEGQSLLADNSPETENRVAAKFLRKRKNVSAAATRVAQTDSSVKENRRVFFDSENLLEIYPSAVGKALKQLGNQKNLGPEEMRLLKEQELLKKDPIIAPDGYIPNSVIRRKLKPPKDVSFGKVEKPFKLKPVPKANPQHMPIWWEEEKECESPRIEYRVMKWDDTPSPPPKSEISSVSSVSLKSLIESPVKKYIAEGRSKTTTPRSPKSKSEQKNGTRSVSKSRNDMTPVENVKKMVKANNENMKPRKSGWEDSPPLEMADTEQNLMRSKPTSRLSDMLRFSSNLSEASKTGDKAKPGTPNTYNSSSAKSRVSSSTGSSIVMGRRLDLSRLEFEMKTPDSARRGRQSGALSEGKEKSFKLTDYAVDEDSSAIHVKETKSERRLKSHLNHTIIKQLLKEEWMPGVEEDFDYNDIIKHLVTILGNSDNPIVYESACSYIGNLFKQMGMTEDQIEQFLGMLGINLDHIDSSVRKHTVRTLQAIGEGRLDVLVMILPKLLDQEESVRQETADAIRVLTGATDKETLLNILEELGVTSTYSSKADEMHTLAMLAEKFGEHLDDPQIVDRIKHWLEASTPGTFEIDKEDEDMLWQEGTRSGMWQEGTRSGMQWQEGTRSGMWQEGTKSGMQWQEGTRSGMQWQEGTRSGKEYSFMSEGKSVIDMYDTSDRNTMYADLPATPGSFSDNDEIIFSRGVSMNDAKSVGVKSEKSRYNARMDLLDRAGASILPGERLEQPTPLSDIMGNDVLNEVFLMDDGQSPFMQDPLLDFDQEPLTKEKSDVSKGTAKSSPKSLENLFLKERTLTDLSQVGPLPNFMPRDNTGRNFDEVSTDSAFESAISVSEYDTSHFSDKWTMSHTDQHSSKHSQLSEDNNMFDVEQVSNLEYEGDDAESGIDVNSMQKHENENRMKHALAYNMNKIYVNENADLDEIEKSNSMSSSVSDEIESGKISVLITPRSTTLGKETPSTAGGPAAGVSAATKRDGPLTPRSRGTGSTFKRRMKDYDGFSTISDRSSSSRKSRRSERTPTSDIGRRNSSRADNLKLRQDSQSELQSTASTEHGLPLPYTLPSQDRNSRFSGTSSSRSHQRIGMKVSPRNILQETQENVSEAKTEDVIAMNESSRMTEADKVEPMLDKAKTASTERTTVSIDTNTASIDTQLVSKGTPTNTPEIPTQANLLPLSTQDAAVTSDNQKMEPISEDKETASFLKTPRDPASVIPMVAKETGERDIEKLSRFLPKSSFCYDYYDKKDSKSEESKSGKQFHKDSEQEMEKLAAEKKHKELEQLATEKKYKELEQLATEKKYKELEQLATEKKYKELEQLATEKKYKELEQLATEKKYKELGQLATEKIKEELEQLATEKRQEEQEQATEKIQDKDSDYQTISNIPSSQIAERLSGFDSGISKDMSEFSYGRAFGRGFPHAPLSPVKSESGSPPLPLSALKSPKGKGKDWRKFFEMVPNAQERKQMEQIRREMEQGKLKHATLPPISYFAEDLPMLPGEAGTRLLQTVRVGEKMPVPGDGRHRIKTVPGKLAVHTQNEDAGLSNFGIIQMQWTTGVPTVKDRIYPPQQIPQHRSHRMIQGHDESELNSTRIRQGMSEEELNLPYLDTASPALSNRYAPNQYEWEFPLPPPPAKESRTEVPQIKKDHETYCKYYQLVKKKLHLYTSPLGFIPALIAAEKERPKPKQKERTKHLPQVFVKRLHNQDKQQDTTSGETPKKQRSLTKTDITSPVLFPPIKLRQLVNIC